MFSANPPAPPDPESKGRDSPSADAANDPPSSPRALARGAGYVFQVVGLVLLLGGCCVGPLVGYFQGEQDRPPDSVGQWLRSSPPGQLLTAVNIITSGLAGFGLLVFGLGLHQERRSSGTGAMMVTGLLAASWWTTAVAAILVAPSLLRIPVNVLLAAGATLLFLLAGAARRELKLHPPPPDEPVTEEFLKQLERRRHAEWEEVSEE
ncbi:MAG: hypothetical protein HRF43_01055 [Phycisphaerae bacterium]